MESYVLSSQEKKNPSPVKVNTKKSTKFCERSRLHIKWQNFKVANFPWSCEDAKPQSPSSLSVILQIIYAKTGSQLP